MIVLGVDPDLNGGLAVVDTDSREILDVIRMPVKAPPTGGRRALHASEAWAFINKARSHHKATWVALESAIVKPQIGKGGGEAMTGSVGRIHQTYGGLLALNHVVFGRPAVITAWPSAWKRAMGLGSDKKESLELASSLYPSHAKLFSKVKNAGLSEAALLAEWARVQLTTGWKK